MTSTQDRSEKEKNEFVSTKTRVNITIRDLQGDDGPELEAGLAIGLEMTISVEPIVRRRIWLVKTRTFRNWSRFPAEKVTKFPEDRETLK